MSRLNLVAEKGIPYIIMCGQAVLLYGEPRMTRDIDITLGTGCEALPNLLDLIKTIPLKTLPDDIDNFVTRTMVLPTIDERTGIGSAP